MNHMLDTQHYFVKAARGNDASPPSPHPPELLSDDPVADFTKARAETLNTFGEDGVIEKTGPSLGIAFSDQLLTAGTSPGQQGRTPRCPKTSRRRHTR